MTTWQHIDLTTNVACTCAHPDSCNLCLGTGMVSQTIRLQSALAAARLAQVLRQLAEAAGRQPSPTRELVRLCEQADHLLREVEP